MKGKRSLSNDLKNNLMDDSKNYIKNDVKDHSGKQSKKKCVGWGLSLLLTAACLWEGGGIQGAPEEAPAMKHEERAGGNQGGFPGMGLIAYAQEDLAGEEQEYIFPESGERLLTEEDLEGLEEEELPFGLLEIYARHGMIFADESLNEYFKEKDWYFGFIHEDEFPEDLLNEFEADNAEFLKQKISGRSEKEEEGVGAHEIGGQEPETESQKQEKTGLKEEREEKQETEKGRGEEGEKETESTEKPEPAPEKAETEPAELTEKTPEDQIIKIPEPGTSRDEGRLLDMQDVDIMGIYGGEEGSEQNSGGKNGNRGQDIRASEYIFPDVASRYLSRSEVEVLSLQAICYAKNEIYARHGRKFLARELQEYFGSKSWYQGRIEPDAFSDKVFNDFERQNLLLIVECEQAVRGDGYQLDQPGYDISLVGTADKYTAAAANVPENSLGSRDYIFPDSDVRYLTEAEVEGLSPSMAHLAWNEIYARRGYIFGPGETGDYFRSKDWYTEKLSPQDFTADMLNKFEQHNIRLLYEREQK